MVFCDVFPACPAGMLPTLQEKNWGLPILIGNNQVRLVMFKQAYLLSSMVGLCLWPVRKRCSGTEPRHPGSASRQDSYNIGQDGRRCVQQTVETFNRDVTL